MKGLILESFPGGVYTVRLQDDNGKIEDLKYAKTQELQEINTLVDGFEYIRFYRAYSNYSLINPEIHFPHNWIFSAAIVTGIPGAYEYFVLFFTRELWFPPALPMENWHYIEGGEIPFLYLINQTGWSWNYGVWEFDFYDPQHRTEYENIIRLRTNMVPKAKQIQTQKGIEALTLISSDRDVTAYAVDLQTTHTGIVSVFKVPGDSKYYIRGAYDPARDGIEAVLLCDEPMTYFFNKTMQDILEVHKPSYRSGKVLSFDPANQTYQIELNDIEIDGIDLNQKANL